MAKAQQPETDAQAYILIDTNRGTEKECESWEEAQEKKNDMVSLGAKPEDFEIEPISNGHAEPETETEMSDENGETPEFEDRDEPDAEPVEVVDQPQAKDVSDLPVVTDRMQDPLRTLPEWMKTEIQHGNDTAVDLNKRGSQVISNALELVVSAECEISAQDTDFEYCRYRATVQTPDGEVYNAVGDAHINESNTSKWDLERLAETRAKKRAVKWATGGGIQAFVEARENDAQE